MRNEDNNCIRYLMKEMDPSEELLMERAMMEDENLLIEVESMRQTFSKLDDLPQVEPPSHVQQFVLREAADQAAKKRESHSVFRPVYKYAVAATLALTVTAGGMWFYMSSDDTKDLPSKDTVASSVPQQSSIFGQDNNTIHKVSAKDAKKVEPWVDRNNILYFKDQFTNQGNITGYEAIFQSSTKKLQLVDKPIFDNRPVKSIQLTGSSN